jgi:Domain of unknown function (DUF4032)
MSNKHQAMEDFERAFQKGFWRQILRRLQGKSNELIAYDAVRERIPIIGQRYLGLQEVELDKIIGSLGRYRDFDRAFLPKGKWIKDRWVNVDMAHYQEITLPPVDLYKMGDIYFVKDGNHRISVALQKGQSYIDAFVTEINVPVLLSRDLDLEKLDIKAEYAMFLSETGFHDIFPDIDIEMTLRGEYHRLLEHISTHRWYLGEQRGAEVPYREAVESWYEKVYLPMVDEIRKHDLVKHFSDRTEADLYLWMIEYMWYLRESYREDSTVEYVSDSFIQNYAKWPVKNLIKLLSRAAWVEHLILDQEREAFLKKTEIQTLIPEAEIRITVPGLYERILEHISVHQWYLGEEKKQELPFAEAVVSWYQQVYFPLVKIIREQEIISEFPGRSESDLYLWIIEHQAQLKQIYGHQVSVEETVDHLTEDNPDPSLPRKLYED